MNRFVQIHTLHSYSAGLVNRDNLGQAKRMPFGGAVRTRISSQCLKRHWRLAKDDEYAIHNVPGATKAYRSRNIVDSMVMPAVDDSEVTEEVLNAVTEAFNVGIYGSNGASKSKRQPLMLGWPEIEFLRFHAKSICNQHPSQPKAAQGAVSKLFKSRQHGKTIGAMLDTGRLPAGLESALFGRMVTSDPRANIEAAIHVAHALTVHGEESEADYFSVVDDLQNPNTDTGAAHIGDMELSAGIFYGYVVCNLPVLISNLEGCAEEAWQDADRSMAGKVVDHLIHLIATVTPGAKLGSTAPYTCADLVLVEVGHRQPRSLANAFRTPTSAQVPSAVKALGSHMTKLDNAYGYEERRALSVEACDLPHTSFMSLDELGAWVSDMICSTE